MPPKIQDPAPKQLAEKPVDTEANGVHGKEVYGDTLTKEHLDGELLWRNVYIRRDPYEVERFDD